MSADSSRILALLSQTGAEEKLAGLILWIKQQRNQLSEQSSSDLSAQQVFDAVGEAFITGLLQSNNPTDQSNEARLRTLFAKVGVPLIDRSEDQAHLSANHLLVLHLLDLLSKHNVTGLNTFVKPLIDRAIQRNQDPEYLRTISRILHQINKPANDQLVSQSTIYSLGGIDSDESLKQLASSLTLSSPMVSVFDQLIDQSSVSSISRVRDTVCDDLMKLSIADPDEPSLIPIKSISHIVRRLMAGSEFIVPADVQTICQSTGQPPSPSWVYTARYVLSNALRSRLPQESRRDCFELIDLLMQSCGPVFFCSQPANDSNAPYSLAYDEQFLIIVLAALRVEVPLVMLNAPALSPASISTLHSTLSVLRQLIEFATSEDDTMPTWSFRAVEQLQLTLKASAESIAIFLQHSEFETNSISPAMLDCIHFVAVWMREDAATLREELAPRLGFLLRICGEESLVPFAEALTDRVDEPEVLDALSQSKVLHRYASFFNCDALEPILELHDSDSGSTHVIEHIAHECGVVSDLLRAVMIKTTGVNRSAIVVELVGSHLPSMLHSAIALVRSARRISSSAMVDDAVKSTTFVLTLLGLTDQAHIIMQDQQIVKRFVTSVAELARIVVSTPGVDEQTALALFRALGTVITSQPLVKAQLAESLRDSPITSPAANSRLEKAIQVVTKVLHS